MTRPSARSRIVQMLTWVVLSAAAAFFARVAFLAATDLWLMILSWMQ